MILLHVHWRTVPEQAQRCGIKSSRRMLLVSEWASGEPPTWLADGPKTLSKVKLLVLPLGVVSSRQPSGVPPTHKRQAIRHCCCDQVLAVRSQVPLT